jgi:hypothetical protein
VVRARYLDEAERAFLIFHLTPPPPNAWRFLPEPEGTVLCAVKPGAGGAELTATVPATSFERLSQFFTDDYRVDLAALAAFEVEVADAIDL